MKNSQINHVWPPKFTTIVAATGILCISLTAGAMASTSTTPDPTLVLSILGRDQSKSDVLPAYLRDGAQALTDIDTTTSRLAGKDGDQSVWVALSESREICLVILIDPRNQFVSSTCKGQEEFSRTGLGIQSETTRMASRIYLLPDGYSKAASDQLRRIASNVVAGDPLASVDEVRLDADGRGAQGRQTLVLSAFDGVGE
jgi:hypothetical protein